MSIVLKRAAARTPLAPVVAAMFAVAVAVLVFATPQGLLERWVSGSGLPAFLAAAEPPLGLTARALLALLLGAIVGAVLWLGLSSLGGLGDRFAKRSGAEPRFDPRSLDEMAEPVRRRRPIVASAELGPPLMTVKGAIPNALPEMAEADATVAAEAEIETIVLTPPADVIETETVVDPFAVEAPSVEPVADTPSEPVGEPIIAPVEPETQPEPVTVAFEAEPPVAEEAMDAIADLIDEPVPAFAAAVQEPEPVIEQLSIEELMRRLEAGLDRRAPAPQSAPNLPRWAVSG